MPRSAPVTYDAMRRICPAKRQPPRNPVDGFPIEIGPGSAFDAFRHDIRNKRSPEPGEFIAFVDCFASAPTQ